MGNCNIRAHPKIESYTWSTYGLLTFYLLIREKGKWSDDGFTCISFETLRRAVTVFRKKIIVECELDTMQRCSGMKNDDIEMCICAATWRFQPLQFSWLNQRQRTPEKRAPMATWSEINEHSFKRKRGKKMCVKSGSDAKWAQENRFE